MLDQPCPSGYLALSAREVKRPMLYFELRHGAETVDPKPWLGL